MTRYLLLLFLSLSLSTQAQEFATSKIPAALRKNADVVVRNEEEEINVLSTSKVIKNYKIVFSVMDKQGDDYATLAAFYDKSSSINNLKVILYDSLGVKVKDYNKNDFSDQSQISSYSMYEDDRVKFLSIGRTQYPYTIEFSYSENYETNFYIPSWYPQSDYNLAVEKSSYQITHPKSLPIKYKESPISEAQIKNVNDNDIISFSCQNLPAIEKEDLSVGIKNITPWALVSATKFNYEDTEGDFSTWNSFGEWVYNLSKGLDQLPPDVAATVHQLTDQLTNPKEKIKVLYHYLQSKTRYISVQLGIGGFKPFPATKVATNNYGDCKALSNYMKALLKEAKIPSQLVLIKAGANQNMYADFCSLQANHMILCVPMAKDTVWLECTSQTMPFNYLGSFTENRTAILISDNGGKVVQTPIYKPEENFQIRTANVKVDENGDAICKISTSYGGEQFEDHEYQLHEEPKNQKENIYKYIAIANPDLINFSYQQKDKDIPDLEEDMDLKANKLLNGVGNSLFLTLNLMNKRQYIPSAYEARKTNFAIGYSYHDKDEITYELPANYKVDFVPKDQEIDSEFGKYKIQTKVEGNKITYIREQTMWKKSYPPSKYNDLINFYKAIYKADKQKAVITSPE